MLPSRDTFVGIWCLCEKVPNVLPQVCYVSWGKQEIGGGLGAEGAAASLGEAGVFCEVQLQDLADAAPSNGMTWDGRD